MVSGSSVERRAGRASNRLAAASGRCAGSFPCRGLAHIGLALLRIPWYISGDSNQFRI